MPVSFSRLPASTNSGMASSMKLCVPESTSCTGIVSGRLPCCRKNAMPEMPNAKATGIPMSMNAANRMITSSMSASPSQMSSVGPCATRSGSPCRAAWNRSRSLRTVDTSISAHPTGTLSVTQV